MLLWRILVHAAEKQKIDRIQKRARAWVHRHLPEMLVRSKPYRGKESIQENFDWNEEWTRWQSHFTALRWLAGRREKSPRPNSPADRIPHDVQVVIDLTIGNTRNAIQADLFSESRVLLQLTNRHGELAGFNNTRKFDDFDTFWQAVFVTFFQPEAFPFGSFCSKCGEPLPRTKKLNKPSKSKLCPDCNTQEWRTKHPDKARKGWKKSKQRERQQMASCPPGDY